MKDDKKKLAIVGALVCMVVGVGAFQFMKSGSGGSVKAPPPKKKAAVEAPKDETAVKNPEFANKLPERDPFKASGDTAAAPPTAKPQPPQPQHLNGALATNNAGSLPMPVGIPQGMSPGLSAPTFNYRLSGLILGRHPAAVFTDTSDKSASQRLVPIGGSLDGDSQLVAVSKGLAVVSFRGKHLKLTLGGTPDAN